MKKRFSFENSILQDLFGPLLASGIVFPVDRLMKQFQNCDAIAFNALLRLL